MNRLASALPGTHAAGADMLGTHLRWAPATQRGCQSRLPTLAMLCKKAVDKLPHSRLPQLTRPGPHTLRRLQPRHRACPACTRLPRSVNVACGTCAPSWPLRRLCHQILLVALITMVCSDMADCNASSRDCKSKSGAPWRQGTG